MRNTLITIGKGAALLVALVAAYLLLGVAAWLVPDAPVRRHVEQTIAYGDMGEDYPKAIVRERLYEMDPYTMDNYTDALILNQVVSLRSEGLKGILLLPRHDEGMVQSYSLRNMMEGTDAGWTFHYARYWHGTTFVARLLLALTSYSGIRYLLYFFSSLLLLWCLIRMWHTVGKPQALILAFSLLAVNVFVMQFSLQFVPVLLLATGGIIWLTYHPAQEGWLAMLVIGSLTAFFDLITVPTITLGLPLVVWVAMHCEETLGKGLWQLVRLGLWWLAGYALTWLSKWGIATLLTGENIFADAYGQSVYWSEGGGSYIVQALTANLGMLHWKWVLTAFIVLLLAAVWHPRLQGWKEAVRYLVLAMIPFAYYVVMAHPAVNHAWYNYRALVVAVSALLMAVSAMVDWQKTISAFKKFSKSR